MGADIEGDGRLGGDRSDPPVVDVCLPPDGQFHQPHDTAFGLAGLGRGFDDGDALALEDD